MGVKKAPFDIRKDLKSGDKLLCLTKSGHIKEGAVVTFREYALVYGDEGGFRPMNGYYCHMLSRFRKVSDLEIEERKLKALQERRTKLMSTLATLGNQIKKQEQVVENVKNPPLKVGDKFRLMQGGMIYTLKFDDGQVILYTASTGTPYSRLKRGFNPIKV
jgi:hypothetical protein